MLKTTFIAATFVAGLATAASAMPVSNLGAVDTGVQTEQVRTVCNAWGRCWWAPGPRYYGYGYYGRPYYRPYAYGYRPYRYGYYGGYRRYW